VRQDRDDERGDRQRQLALGIVSLVASIPITIPLAVTDHLPALVVSWAGIVAVNFAHASVINARPPRPLRPLRPLRSMAVSAMAPAAWMSWSRAVLTAMVKLACPVSADAGFSGRVGYAVTLRRLRRHLGWPALALRVPPSLHQLSGAEMEAHTPTPWRPHPP
jgi:hypothetical protein